MPTLIVKKKKVQELLQREFDDHWFERTLFDFGLELDDTVEEEGECMYRIDIPANRYDLLCTEGLCYALRVFLSMEEYEDIEIEEGRVSVYKSGGRERPCVACAIVRGVDFRSEETYRSFIDYQDKLHLTIGRNRTLVSMGTHDLDKIQAPIFYRSETPDRIVFKPLSADRRMSAQELSSYFAPGSKIGKYMKLIEKNEKYPYFEDSKGTVLSLPPVINSDATKIDLETKNVFIDVTGTDFHRVNTALKLILGCFRGKRIESVEILDGDERIRTPIMHNHLYTLELDEINRRLGLDLSLEVAKTYMERMMHKASIVDGKTLQVKVHDIRSDVIHKCDLIEDVAIAHGFNNFKRELPLISTIGSEDPLNRFSDKLRMELSIMGFDEALTLTLLSRQENIIDGDLAVVLMNPKSIGYEVCRTSLIPGLMKTVASNLHVKIPFKLFEVSDVVLLDKENQSGARNSRRLAALYCGHSPCLEEVQGSLSLLLEKCGVQPSYTPHDDPIRYLKNQGAFVVVEGIPIGSIGVCNPEICRAFKVPYAASFFEIDAEKLFSVYKDMN
ncbi:phenylalanyl-tRNA synthetase subunit beta [Encephalitozoon intestinalis ATCC 50506]|uniref:phenylalanine--tRNA ligase n=1 Tax=Encephalitozoon intestinalis (strain ATCC 50506) TaxID=876142 RepID=E0S6P0_ENCIT|nr:phenylalanyl-tRNA synthetase subunit beta [Encephalitozoon intestinalis ATCC 50506]ADM11375.1 phenylalanyl-tRNA synthetase subunit beta [Encephalitozoon intestinalis ATCC 50506]UTX45065.1 phenylalanyl-tRNA synthetase subunit beta [Encephalitozoon intestinalis]